MFLLLTMISRMLFVTVVAMVSGNVLWTDLQAVLEDGLRDAQR